MNIIAVDIHRHLQQHIRTKRGFLATFATVSGITLLLLTAMYSASGSSDAALAVPAAISGEPDTSTAFRYFPSDYRNHAQSGPAEEHIQAY
jgi:hypothetical protein